MPVPMPNYSDLGKMWEMNPLAFGQAQDQMGLAQQFAGQEFAQGQEKLRQQQLANMFQEKSDPLRLQQMQLDNEGKGFANRTAGVNTRIAEGTQDQAMATKIRELMAGASKADMDMLERDAQRMAYSNDPRERAIGLDLLRHHKDFISKRDEEASKHSNRLAEIRAQGDQAMRVENARIGAGKYADKRAAKMTLQGLITSKNYQQAALQATIMAMEAGNPQEQQKLLDLANQMKQADLDARGAAATVGRTGRLDEAAMLDEPAIQPTPPAPLRVPGAQPPNTPQRQSGAVNAPPQLNIPAGAVQMLKSNPALAPQFDAKYGPGSAARVLQGK